MLYLMLAIPVLLIARVIYIVASVLLAEDVEAWAESSLYEFERPIIHWFLVSTMSPKERALLKHLNDQRQRRKDMGLDE